MFTAPLDGLLHFTPTIHEDHRGSFLEWFKASDFENATGYPFDLQQANLSTSKSGTIRGLHFADIPPGQAKYITCVAGRIWDVAVDIRVGSPTYLQHFAVELSAENRQGLYLQSGFAHGFVALEDSTVVYLTTNEYQPEIEHAINPFDEQIAVPWPEADYILSEKDRTAPALSEVTCPAFDDARSHYAQLKDFWVLANQED